MIGEPILEPTAIYFWLPILVVFLCNICAFIFCQIKKDNSYIDIVWGIIFIMPIISILTIRIVDAVSIPARIWLVAAFVTIWGIRLAIHIGLRHKEEDFRYVQMRVDWMVDGLTVYYVKAFFFIFMLQALLSILVNGSALFVCIYTA